MKKLLILALIVMVASPVMAQRGPRRGSKPKSGGFYIMLGGATGPSFSDFTDYVNNTYKPILNNTQDKLKDFGSGFTLNIGYISRFHRNFAVDVGFSLYGLKSKGTIRNYNPDTSLTGVYHDLDYQVGIFTGTIPIIFDFAPRQRVVPYVGVGISIFAMRLDDFRDDGQFTEALRDTRTAVGGHFEAGLAFKVTRRIWIDARGRWHDGTGHLLTLEDLNRDFTIKQSIAQYSLGVDYFFR